MIMFPSPETGFDYPVMMEVPFELDNNITLKGTTTFEVLQGRMAKPLSGETLSLGEVAYIDERGLYLNNWQADKAFLKNSSAVSVGRVFQEMFDRPNKTALILPNAKDKLISIGFTFCPQRNICALVKSMTADGTLSQESGILFTKDTETKTFEDLTINFSTSRDEYYIAVTNAGDKYYILTLVADEIEPTLPN